MPNPNHPREQSRGLTWLIFRLPGAVILWLEYHFPKHGDAWGSARRFGKPASRFFTPSASGQSSWRSC